MRPLFDSNSIAWVNLIITPIFKIKSHIIGFILSLKLCRGNYCQLIEDLETFRSCTQESWMMKYIVPSCYLRLVIQEVKLQWKEIRTNIGTRLLPCNNMWDKPLSSGYSGSPYSRTDYVKKQTVTIRMSIRGRSPPHVYRNIKWSNTSCILQSKWQPFPFVFCSILTVVRITSFVFFSSKGRV